MLKRYKKNLKKSILATAVDEFLYVSYCTKTMIFGIGCIFSCLTYAEVEVSKDNTIENNITSVITAENALQQEQNIAVDTQHLNTAMQQFQDEAVYQLDINEIPPIDQNMVNEIYQIAEQAQQDAKLQEQQIPEVIKIVQAQPLQTDQTDTGMVDSTEQVQVDSLMQELATEQLDIPDVVIQNQNPTINNDINISTTSHQEKKGFFSRLFNRKDDFTEQVEQAPKIDVTVRGVNGILAENITAKLSSFTVDAFEDFTVALPQIKDMTTQAAQAVGYYQSTFRFSKLDENSLLVEVQAKDPVEVKSQEIEFSGDGAERPSFQVVKIVPDLNLEDIFNHGLYETTKSRITSAATDQGYFDAYWRMHDVKVTLPENTADITLKYETGERYKLHDVEFRMSDPSKSFPLRKSVLEMLVPFKDGDDYMDWRVNLLSNNLINSRYFNFALVNVIKPDAIDKPLELPDDVKQVLQQQNIKVAEQTNQTDAEQEVQTQTVVDENVFAGANQERSLKIAGAEEADADLIETENLKQQARADKKIPVIVYLNADTVNNLETGIGYGTDTGVRLRTQYRRSIVNDRGHSFDANMELSRIRQSIDGRYNIPYKHPLDDYFSIVGGYEREVRDGIGQGVELDIESAVLGAERSIKRPLGEWQHNMSVRYRLDRINSNGAVNYDDVPDAFKVISSDPEQESLLFGYEISRTDQDNRINPTKGFRQFYRAEVGSGSLLTETDMAIINAGWRFIYSLGENADHQFVGRGDLGYIVTDNFDQVPYNLRYFAGGDQSIRGYDYKSLSPTEDNLLLGGQALAIGSLEYNYQFKEGWRAAVFADVGNAYDEKFSNETKYGVGLGIRWASPVGPIRIDVGAGVSEDSIPIRLHFFIGPAL